MHSSGGGLELALVLLLAAVIAVPVFKRLGLWAVLAYLVAGVMLGPDGLGFVQDADRILNAAEIGVVMLMFVIGLELSPSRLMVMRRTVFGAGALQVLLSAAALLLRDALYFYLKNKNAAYLTDAKNIEQIKKELADVLDGYLRSGQVEDMLFESYLSR